MAQFYSQSGEDFIIGLLFPEKQQGFFVEVGCIDGRRFSNTLALEERGWTGLCIEAHADYIDLLKKNRPNSRICHCAAGEADQAEIVFYANARGSLSSVDKSTEARWQKDYAPYFSGFEEQKVSMRTLTSLFQEHQVGHIDVLSLDIEGYEIPALRGLDFAQYRPAVLVIEFETTEDEKHLDQMLVNEHGYYKSVTVHQNIFYLDNPDWAPRIENQVFQVQVVHTQHPLDTTGDQQKALIIDTHL